MTSTRQERAIREIELADLLDRLKAMGDALYNLRLAVTNNVLGTEFATMDADGAMTRSYQQPVSCIYVVNHSTTTDAIVTSGPKGNGPPGGGPGTFKVEKGKSATVNIKGAQFTIWSAAGQTVSFTAFDKPQPPGN